MRGWRTITSVVRIPCVSCSSLAAALCVLRLSYTSQKTQANRKENDHVENSLRQPCDLVFRTAVLRCSILHREAAARNPENCRRGQVHGCRKADVTQALLTMFVFNSNEICSGNRDRFKPLFFFFSLMPGYSNTIVAYKNKQ